MDTNLSSRMVAKIYGYRGGRVERFNEARR